MRAAQLNQRSCTEKIEKKEKKKQAKDTKKAANRKVVDDMRGLALGAPKKKKKKKKKGGASKEAPDPAVSPQTEPVAPPAAPEESAQAEEWRKLDQQKVDAKVRA